MNALQIVIGQRWQEDVRYLYDIRLARPSGASLNPTEFRDVIDLVVDGRNITAHIDEESVFGLISELVRATEELLEDGEKVLVEFPTSPYELVLVPHLDSVLISLYSVDHEHRVYAHNARVGLSYWVQGVTRAAEHVLAELLSIDDRFATNALIRAMGRNVAWLNRQKLAAFEEQAWDSFEISGGTSTPSGLSLHYELMLDSDLQSYRGSIPFDLHALLVKGHIAVEWQEKMSLLSSSYPLLSVMAIAVRVRELLSLVEAGTQRFVCARDSEHLNLEIRAERQWTLSCEGGLDAEVRPNECLETLISVVEMILRDLRESNSKLALNQRFNDLVEEASELRSWFSELSASNTYFETPEEFLRDNAQVRPERKTDEMPTFTWPFESVKALYPREKWRLDGETIQFKGIELVGDKLLIPTSEALEARYVSSGALAWELLECGDSDLVSYSFAADTLVAATQEGTLWLIEPEDGHVRCAVECEPREATSLLLDAASYSDWDRVVIAEMNGAICGVSKTTGRAQWSHDSSHGYMVGVAFDGPLVTTLSSPGFLQAFHPLSGDRLWRVRLGGVADLGPYLHEGRIYALTHDPLTHGLSVHSVYPFTGRTHWMLRVEGALVGPPDFIGNMMIMPIESHGRIQLFGVDLEARTPSVSWSLDLLTAGLDRPTRIVSVEVDGHLCGVVKTDRGELTCFRLQDGEVVWRERVEVESGLLFRNIDMLVVRDSLLTKGDRLEIRALSDGSLLHTIDELSGALDFIMAVDNLDILVGSIGSEENSDELICLALSHFLALVPAD